MNSRTLTRLTMLLLGMFVLSLAPAAAMAEEITATTPTSTTTAPAETTPASPPASPAEAPSTTSVPAPSTPAPTTSTPEVTTPAPATPEVKTQIPQAQSTGPTQRTAKPKVSKKSSGTPAGDETPSAEEKAFAHHKKALAPSALTPALPSSLGGSVSGVPDFFVNSFSIPPFLLPIYQAAGSAYGIPWQVLAAINEVETDYGRDLNVSSAGAEGWMQFLPSEWDQYGVDATAQGFEDPDNPADAIFAAARYLKAAGGTTNIRAAVFSYNHSQAYVDSVMMRAQLLGGTPPGLLSAITGLTEARFPVHAAAHYADGFPSLPSGAAGSLQAVPGTVIYSTDGAPVIAVQDGVITRIGESPTLGRYISLRDAYGNTYTYAELGEIAQLYPVLELRGHSSAPSGQEAQASSTSEPAPSGPATAGAQPRSPLSAAAVSSTLALGAAAGIGSEATPSPAAAPAKALQASSATVVRKFRAGPDEVYLHPLKVGVQVIAGTVLGHLGAGEATNSEPHMLFQIRPAGSASPLIDPKPILDGWVLLEKTSIFKAKGADPFAASKPTAGQVLLESKNQLEQQVLRNPDIHIYRCGRGDIQTGKIDRRVLAVLEFLSVSGLQPTVSALKCAHAGSAIRAFAAEYKSGEAVDISAVNGIPIAGHSGPGSIAQSTIAKLLSLQGTVKPVQITVPRARHNAANTLLVPGPYNQIHISFQMSYSSNARLAKAVNSVLSASQWIALISRLGEIPNPTVGSGPSAEAIPDSPAQSGSK
jgi:murein DD-endopeptidase MepM/ murein hydrolase activator NlpD